MRKLEYKSLPLQLTDLSTEHRTAVIAHAAYDNIDRLGDVSRKGMFNKSWAENKGDIGFYLDHKASQQPGIAAISGKTIHTLLLKFSLQRLLSVTM